jgi:hypothetical protein
MVEIIKWYQSRTFWVGVGTIAIGVIEAINTQLLAGSAITVLGILTIIFRCLATSAILNPIDKTTTVTGIKVE